MANRIKTKRRGQRKSTRKATRKATLRRESIRAFYPQRKKFIKKIRGGLRLTYGYMGREYNDSSENDENTRALLRGILNNDVLYSNLNLSDDQKTEMINNTIEALRNIRDSDNQPTNNLSNYVNNPSSRIRDISLINYLFPLTFQQQPLRPARRQQEESHQSQRLDLSSQRPGPRPPREPRPDLPLHRPQQPLQPLQPDLPLRRPQQPLHPSQPEHRHSTMFDIILSSIPAPTHNSRHPIDISYEMKDGNKNFYISKTQNVFETLFEERTSFINYKPYIKYLNISSDPPAYDAGMDMGGLTTHVFSLLSNFFTGSSESSCSASSTSTSSTSEKYSDYFIEYNGFYKLNNIEGELSPDRRDRLYFIGQLFASAIKLRQIIEINLNPLLLYQMLHNDFDSITPAKILEIIENFDLSDTHPFSCFKNPITDKTCNYDEMGTEINDEKDKQDEAMKSLKSKMYNPSVKAFISGFRSIINVEITRLNRLPLKDFSELISGSDIELNYDNLMKHLRFDGFNEYQKDAVKELIQEKSAGNPDWVRAFLFAITSKNKIPISGFPIYKQLTIVLKSLGTEQPPFIVHTCSNIMDLNKSALDEYINSTDKSKTKLYEYFGIETLNNIANMFNIS